MPRVFLRKVFALSMLLSTPLVHGASESTATRVEIPSMTLMPWHTVGIDAETVVQSKLGMQAAQQSLAQALVSAPQSLTSRVEKSQNLSLAAKNLTDHIVTGARSDGGTTPLLVEPVWCSAGDYYVFGVLVSDPVEDKLLSINHVAVAKAVWDAQIEDETLKDFVQPLAKSLADKALEKIKSPSADVTLTNGLHVGIALAQQTTRADVGRSQCFNMIVEEQLVEAGYAISPQLDGDNLGMWRDLLTPGKKIMHPTRTVTFNWEQSKPDYHHPQKLPLLFNLRTTFAESVMGNRLGDEVATLTSVLAVGDQIEIKVPPSVSDFLKNLARSLELTDKPQIAKVYGAWVYVDRGRAYGLKMDDRLQIGAPSSPESIRGHVVGFFGPELKLKSPRGFAIDEGAIVFIRKGQRLTKIGQSFDYDSTKYPTRWPPPEK